MLKSKQEEDDEEMDDLEQKVYVGKDVEVMDEDNKQGGIHNLI